jgi:predicted phosphate transport protein (TIGR00153 family)
MSVTVGPIGGSDRMGFKEWIIPQEKHFFDLLEQQADIVLEGAEALLDLTRNFNNVTVKRDKIKDIEHKGDSMVHTIAEELNKTFVTPIEHDDLSKLTSRLDDVLDYIEAASHRMWSYEIKAVPPDMVKLAEVILASAKEVNHAVKDLRNVAKKNEIISHCIEVNRLENMADDVTHVAVAGLFKGNDVYELIKLKEIYEHLEMATDKCEDVADVIKDVFIKNS